MTSETLRIARSNDGVTLPRVVDKMAGVKSAGLKWYIHAWLCVHIIMLTTHRSSCLPLLIKVIYFNDYRGNIKGFNFLPFLTTEMTHETVPTNVTEDKNTLSYIVKTMAADVLATWRAMEPAVIVLTDFSRNIPVLACVNFRVFTFNIHVYTFLLMYCYMIQAQSLSTDINAFLFGVASLPPPFSSRIEIYGERTTVTTPNKKGVIIISVLSEYTGTEVTLPKLEQPLP